MEAVVDKNAEVKIVNVPLSKIKPYWRNPRLNDDTIPALMKSIERYGFNVPLVVDKKHVIVTGHARYKALLKLGWTKAPCVVSTLSEKELREFRVLDNRVQELTEWDQGKLNVELSRVVNGGDMHTYFGDTLDRVLSFSAYIGEEEEPEPEDKGDEKDPVNEVEPLAVEADSDIAVEPYVPVCPFCETEITAKDVIQ